MSKRDTGAAKAAPRAEQYLPALARAAAAKRRAPREPLSWAAALTEAPWGPTLPPAWETEFRRAYAAELVERGHATEAHRPGKSGASGKTTLKRYQVSQTDEEHDGQVARAEAAGLSWAEWARRKLAE